MHVRLHNTVFVIMNTEQSQEDSFMIMEDAVDDIGVNGTSGSCDQEYAEAIKVGNLSTSNLLIK